ncbi:MAG: aromatic amino acid lyase [Alphaproteobacteria bacterium]
MTVTLNAIGDLDLDAVRRVALDGEGVRFGPAARQRIAKAHKDFQAYVEANRGKFIYGVTSAYGPDAKKHTAPEEQKKKMQSGNPFIGLSFGQGHLPEHTVRAMVLATLSMVVEGTTAAHPDRAAAIAAMLDGPMPEVPTQGLVGAGEILALFHLFSHMPRFPGYQAGTGNGTPATTGMGAISAVFARRRLDLATRLFALSVEALDAPLEAYDPALKGLWGDPYEARALDRLNAVLKGARTKGRRFYQAPVSWRILPRVLGQGERAVATLEAAALDSLHSMAANPTYVPAGWRGRKDGGKTLSTGAYHNANVPPALNGMMATWVDLALLAHRHTTKLHKGEVSLLPDRLLPPGTDVASGRSTTYFEYVPNGFIEEMRHLAQPVLLSPLEPAASEQDDIAAPGPVAHIMEQRVAALFDMTMAVLAATASQALHVTKRAPAPPLRPLLKEIRRHFAPVVDTRKLGPEGERLAAAFGAAVRDGHFGAVRLDSQAARAR